MVAYSFKARFVGPILAGTKDQTIRSDRRRHARPGEVMQLYTGMRTKHCRLIGKPRCVLALPIELDFRQHIVRISRANAPPEELRHDIRLDGFARRDGFRDWDDLCTFWREEHSSVGAFRGVLIRWDSAPLREAFA